MLATKLSTSTLLATARPIASTSSSTFSLQRLLLSTSSKAKSATRTSTSSSNSNYYVATLPWASHKAGTDRFTTLTKDVRFSQNDNIGEFQVLYCALHPFGICSLPSSLHARPRGGRFFARKGERRGIHRSI